MESRLFQYSIPYFSFDNAKFHSMGNEDHSMGNEDLFDGERGSIRWGTRFYSMGTRWYEFMPLLLRLGVLRPSSISVTGMGFILS